MPQSTWSWQEHSRRRLGPRTWTFDPEQGFTYSEGGRLWQNELPDYYDEQTAREQLGHSANNPHDISVDDLMAFLGEPYGPEQEDPSLTGESVFNSVVTPSEQAQQTAYIRQQGMEELAAASAAEAGQYAQEGKLAPRANQGARAREMHKKFGAEAAGRELRNKELGLSLALTNIEREGLFNRQQSMARRSRTALAGLDLAAREYEARRNLANQFAPQGNPPYPDTSFTSPAWRGGNPWGI